MTTTKRFFDSLKPKDKQYITYAIRQIPWYNGEKVKVAKQEAIWAPDKRIHGERICAGQRYTFEVWIGQDRKLFTINHYWQRFEVESE